MNVGHSDGLSRSAYTGYKPDLTVKMGSWFPREVQYSKPFHSAIYRQLILGYV